MVDITPKPTDVNNSAAAQPETAALSPTFSRGVAINTLARTMWAEARSEGEIGMDAVACVVLNRAAIAAAHGGRYWWGNDIPGICTAKLQFSCWNGGDANYRAMMHVSATDPQFREAIKIATDAVDGKLADITNGATHYHTVNSHPDWAEGKTPVASIRHHLFYKLT